MEKTFFVPMYEKPNGETYIIVEGLVQPCNMSVVRDNHGHLKKEYFECTPLNPNAIGTLEISIRPNGWIETDYPAKKVFFKDTKKKYLVTELIEYFDPSIGSGELFVSNEDGETYELYVSIPDPLNAPATSTFIQVICYDDVTDIKSWNEPFIEYEGMRKTFISYEEVAWFQPPLHRIISSMKVSGEAEHRFTK